MRFKLLAFLVLLIAFSSLKTMAQGNEKFVTFSGFVIDGNNDEPLPGAYIINERAGRGTLSNEKGYFLLNVFPGDSIVFSYLGFKEQYYIIPKDVGLTYSAVVELNQDAQMLREVKVYPFSTEEEFKLALLEMEVPNSKELDNMLENVSRENLDRAFANSAMSADANYRYAMNQQLMSIQNKSTIRTNPLTSPFAWASFIKSIKNGSFKDKSWKKSDYIPKSEGSRDAIFRNSN